MKFGKISSEAKDPNSRYHDFGMEPDSVSFRECISEMPDNFISVVYFILRQSLALHEILQNVSWWLFLAPQFRTILCVTTPLNWSEELQDVKQTKVLNKKHQKTKTSKGAEKQLQGLKNKP